MGDNACSGGTDSEYQTGYFNMYANIFRKMPQWSCLGNHDANNGSTSITANFPYFDMFTFPAADECGGAVSGTERYYSFDYENIHFICLDSQSSVTTVDNPATTTVNEDGPMATWLRQDLAGTTATWIIAFWHHPPYSKRSHNSDREGQMVNMRTNFNPILENGGVDLVFLGHSHNYERSVLLDGHYGTSGTITNAMKKNSGNASTSGFTTTANGKIRNAATGFIAMATSAGAFIPPDGANIKPLTGPRDHFGAVYNTAGMSGLNPNLNDEGFVEADVSTGMLTKRGKPSPWYQTSINGTDFRVIYIRRKDAVEAGLVYTPQFSGDLVNWVDSAVTPTVIAEDGEVEAVSVEYPLFPAAPEAGFFRLGVRITHGLDRPGLSRRCRYGRRAGRLLPSRKPWI